MSRNWIVGGAILGSVALAGVFYLKPYLLERWDDALVFHTSNVYAAGYIINLLDEKLTPEDAKEKFEALLINMNRYPASIFTNEKRKQAEDTIKSGLEMTLSALN